MKTCAIIAEYDPFHNGHNDHIKQIRKMFDCILILMGGYAMQRGEIASFNKYERAKAALLNGADLILELPAVFSSASALKFALGAVSILQNLHSVHTLSFGSESGDLPKLQHIETQYQNPSVAAKFKQLLKEGLSYPSARQQALNDPNKILKKPNNLLGIEYIHACRQLNANFIFHTVKREKSQHNKFASASYLRKNQSDIHKFTPANTHKFYTSCSDRLFLDRLFLYLLRNMKNEELKCLPDVTEGLENRFTYYLKSCNSLSELLMSVKSKRYTLSRLKRIALYAALQITKEDFCLPAPYAHILGFNQIGRLYLQENKKNFTIMVTPNFKQISKRFPKLSQIDRRAADLFALAQNNAVMPLGEDFIRSPMIL